MTVTVEKIISGGQTGADRGGLDAAMALEIPHGGFCPRGRRAEDGRIPLRYKLTETASGEYPQRTRMNVEAANATLIFVRRMSRGSQLTIEFAQRTARPFLVVVVRSQDQPAAAKRVREFL